MTADDRPPSSEVILYQTEDGHTRIQCRFEDGSIWLPQRLIAELFQVAVPTVNEHLAGVYADGELPRGATIRNFRIVRLEGSREVAREVEHYSLPAILAVGMRVRSQRGTQFRQWALARLDEYLVKGFVMDDERLKNPPGPGVPDYFDELLERIRDIRASSGGCISASATSSPSPRITRRPSPSPRPPSRPSRQAALRGDGPDGGEQ